MSKLPISKIRVRNRYRKNLGDIKSLADSISDLGLLHPVVVRPDGRLIAGERRLRACQSLGWSSIPVTVVHMADIVRGEWHENVHRQNFPPSEVFAIAKAIEPLEKAAALKRMKTGKRPSGKLPYGTPGQTRDKIGAFAGMSGRTIEKIMAVCVAAQRDSKRFGPLVTEMDRTNRVDAPYRKLRQKEDEQRRLSVKPLEGKYRTLVIDVPWQYPGEHRARPEYATMTQNELLDLPVQKLADNDAHLYLWSNNRTIPEAVELMAAWGFTFVTLLTWIKPSIGLGSYFRGTTEHCLFGVRGNLITRPPHDIPTHFEASKARHSVKPEEFYRLVERASYPPFVDVFARKTRPGWACWGAGLVQAA